MGEGIEQIECRFRVVAIHTIAVSQDCRGHAAATDLPDKDDAAESLMTGGEVNAMLLVLVVKGAWMEDVDKLQRERHHDGVLDLASCGHVGRSWTAWGNVEDRRGKENRRRGGSGAYQVKSTGSSLNLFETM